ncbi:MFS transporter [Aurantiacibacter rhizosphaerae]|uniref:MFS transporter n=1 Tax=Aurantiacibacter rhizosphaerae TaxID=2691582 RepID=A0A844XF38_9SPHN|nr:MFS transporter [Aurantiacibacter rhizosphaerae]MWV28188.1 MFS transporter [Aurantiacibacter rhizosphaerae]
MNAAAAIPETADSTEWKPVQIIAVGLCFLLNMLDGADLLVMSFVAPVLSDEWSIAPADLGIIFSASLAGMAGGCLLIAPLADRFGRRPLIICALAVVAVAMVISSQVHSVQAMVLARFVIGLGVGTIGVTMTAMASEFAPARYRDFAVGFVQAGWPFGSIITAFLTVALLPEYGWRMVLLMIGLLSLGLLVIALIVMPESLDFLLRRQPKNALERANKLGARLGHEPLDALPPKPDTANKIGLLRLFDDGRMRSGIILWLAVALGYFVLYFVINWIPELTTRAGLPVDQAIYAGATYNLGAFLGTSAMGWLAVRFALPRVISLFFFASAVAMLIFGNVSMPLALTLLSAMFVGVSVQGGFNGFWALSARFYPTDIRSTGIGWSMGVGRIGAVLGPLVGGYLVGADLPVGTIFAIYAVPAVLAGLLVLLVAVPERRA